jgi:hypothetical protein
MKPLGIALAAVLGAHTAAAQNGAHVVVHPGFVSGPGSAITGTAGVRYTHTPTPRVVGGKIASVPSIQAIGTAGAAFFTHGSGDVAFTATGQLAYLFPRGAGPIALVGPTVLGSYRPDGIGPGLRIELSYHVIGVSAGALWARHARGPRAMVLVDVPLFFLGDLS